MGQLRLVWLALLVAGVLLALPSAALAVPLTFTVDSTAIDDDRLCGGADCTWPEAVNAANANANPTETDVINFEIPGAGVHQISLLGGFALTEPATVDGTTETDYAGSPLVELNGTGSGGGNGLLVQGDNSAVK